jgi:hypothetical protein
VPFTAVSVRLSDPGTYVPVNCAVEVAAVEDAVLVAVVLVADAVARSGAIAEITLAALEFAT